MAALNHLTMKTKFTLYSLLASGLFSAQVISGKILSNDNNPVPFARIGVVDENIGAVADESGNYKIDLSAAGQDKVLTVQMGGYASFTEKINDFVKCGNYTIRLTEKINDIEEVKLTPDTFENKNWGIKTKAKNVGFWYNSRGNEGGNWKDEIAVSFTNRKKVKIDKINLNINQFDTDKPVVLSFNIYAEENNRPGKSILSEVLTVQVSKDRIKDGTFTFDVSDRSLWVNNQNFYVSTQIVSEYSGTIGFSAALLGAVYVRSYYEKWQKIPVAAPAINIDVKVRKEKRHTA